MNAVLYEVLRKNAIVPQYFGLGFIQCKINDNYRAHFYHPEIKPIVNIEEIHDHRYNFTSYVVKGSIKNKLYEFIEDSEGEYCKKHESCNPLIEVEPNAVYGNIKLLSRNVINENESYFMNHMWFHKVSTEKCVTLLSRTNYTKEYSNVIRSKYSVKICPFSETMPEDDCWKIIKELLEIK